MRVSRQSRWQLRLASSSFTLLLLIVVGLSLWLSRDYHKRFDWTYNGRNSLSPASISILERIDKPIKITAYASQEQMLRQNIRDLITRYQQYHPAISLEFIDPDKEPVKVRDAGVKFDGELHIEYAGIKEPLQRANEEALTNALSRLARGGERWIVFLTGHGERSPERQANFDLSIWAAEMNKRGLKTRSLSLADNSQIPQNTSALVIASPRAKLLAGEVKQIEKFLDNGGSLLWLHDPGSLQGLTPIAETLGIEFLPGVVVDPGSRVLTGESPTFIVIGRYGHHAAVQGFLLNTLYPEAGALRAEAHNDWKAEMLLDTPPSAWLGTGVLNQQTKFDAGKDTRGPLNIGMALTRKQDERDQRVAVVADGDFLSNTFIGNGANLDLGMNLINWVSRDDIYLNIPTRSAPDLQLNLSWPAKIAISLGFLVILPLALISGGGIVWWRRRKR